MATKEELTFDLNGGAVDAGLVTEGEQHWVTYKHRGYREALKQWVYVNDHYTGNVLLPSRIEDYLLVRAAAEHEKAYDERKSIVAYTPHLSAVIDSLVGMMESVDADTERVFQPEDVAGGLGDHEERGTPAYRIWNNADGSGTNYKAFWQKLATELTKYQEMYVVVEGIKRDDTGSTTAASTVQEPRYRAIPPTMVTNVRYDTSGRMIECVVNHFTDARGSIKDDPEDVEQWTYYHLDGFEVYERQKNTQQNRTSVRLVEQGTYEYWDGPELRHKVLPILRVRLPMSRHVAYLGARLCNRIFNTESERQMGTRMGNIARFAVVGGKEQFQQIVAYIKKGGTLIQHWPDQSVPHYYITVPTEPAKVSTMQLAEYIENFYAVMFSQFADASKQVTATQIRQESRSGVEAFLTLLSDAVDEAENGALLRLEQTEFPGNRQLWGHAYVYRSKDFAPVDSEAQVTNMKDRYFPNKPVPIGASGLSEAAKRIAAHDGIPIEDDEVDVETVAVETQGLQDQSALDAFGL